MSEFGELTFAPCLPEAADEAEIKVSVRRHRVICVSLNADAFAKLGSPEALSVEAAQFGEASFLKLTPAQKDKGWPLVGRSRNGRRASAWCLVRTHPFHPGVRHDAEAVIANWKDGGVVLQMPDWAAMRQAVAAEESGEAE